ncbi:MAG: hypothetical protein LUJ09_07115 [Firmicutes bacterium]|nr:hypothetical protein [Bacillota bacterium]
MIEFEEYSLDTAIAACSTKISLGPGDTSNKVCDEYIFVQSIEDQAQIMDTKDGLWYEGSCSCYLSAGDGTLITS